MGFAICRFCEDEGCGETGSQEWHVNLTDLERKINVPSMWKHYMLDHLVQPTAEERELIMAADPAKSTGKFHWTKDVVGPAELNILYVERTGTNQYTHQIGTEPDIPFIDKLEQILTHVQPLQTRGISDFDCRLG